MNYKHIAAGLVILAGTGTPALAASEVSQLEGTVVHRVRYYVRLLGIPIGKAYVTISLKNGEYVLEGSAKTSGITELISKGKGDLVSKGRYDGGRVLVKMAALDYQDDDKTGRVKLEFSNDQVQSIQIDPEPKPRSNKIPLGENHQRAVIDPASTLVVPVARAEHGETVCNRTFPIFDGEHRYDLALRYARTERVAIKGFAGNAFVCRVRYRPIAGHRKNRRNIEYMRNNRNLEIWLARIGKGNIYTPIRFKVGTWLGTAVAKADYFITEPK